MELVDNDIRKLEDLADGSSLYEIGKLLEEDKESSFYKNLAIKFPEEGRKKLSYFLLESIEEDIASRKEWMDSVDKVRKYIGLNIEDLENIPFKESTRTYDTTFATALIRFYATTRAELLPESGPAGYKINGLSNEELENKGAKVRDWLNYYLTVTDKSYYSDFERFLLYLGLYGSGFKKVYYDKLIKRPLARFIMPEDFIIDSDCSSILESNRLTHVLHLSKREIILNQQNGIYREVELPYLKSLENSDDDDPNAKINKKNGIDLDAYTKRSLFPIYEVHTYLNLKDFINSGNSSDTEDIVPLPYIVLIDKISKEILSIRKNWKENDPDQKRRNYFVQYNYLPGFGIYGIGLAQLLGSNAITLTKIQRQLLDAGSFKNLPGGLRAKGFKQQQNDLIIGPGQFVEVDTGGIPLQEAFMPLPYSEPSQVLRELRLEIVNQCKELGSTSEMGMLDSKEDIATGTAMAFLETNNRIQSAVLKSIHCSLTNELQLIDEIFRETLDVENFDVGQQQQEITSDDFANEVVIIPISDPSVNSTPQRIMKAESVLRVSQQAPELHDMPTIFKMIYTAIGLDSKEIEKILKPKLQDAEVLPLDPITENMNAMRGMPLKAAIWQEHNAHIISHAPFANDSPDIKAHIQEHRAFKYLVDIQQELGIELPPLEQLMDPELQNAIALKTAMATENLGMNEEGEPKPIDPNALLMADIDQKKAETAARERIANLKAETDIFKVQLDFEKEKAKIESNEDIAQLKAETELTKQETKYGNQ